MIKYPAVLLERGSLNVKYVLELKALLIKAGYGDGLTPNEPTFGPATEAAVIRFQRAHLLNPDGEVGPLTWQRLYVPRIPVIRQATTLSGKAIEYALTQLYVREKTGKNDGVEVEQYLATVGLGKGYAYCVAFQVWNFDHAAKDLGVKNPLPRTGGVIKMWQLIPDKYKTKTPRKGMLMFMDFGGGAGHQCLVKTDEVVKSGNIYKIRTVDGNTSQDPTMASADREGNGVFERLRNPYASNVLGFVDVDMMLADSLNPVS